MSLEAYREFLWHTLLRGHATFFLWCAAAEAKEEIEPVHAVYAACGEYRDFMEHGRPVIFTLPAEAGPVISGLRLDDRLLIRRTDFADEPRPVTVNIQGLEVRIPRAEGCCQVLEVRHGVRGASSTPSA
jgi:hypothetical protein